MRPTGAIAPAGGTPCRRRKSILEKHRVSWGKRMTRSLAGADKRERASPYSAIPVYQPDLSGNERQYVLECVDTTWISSIGKFIPRFEEALAEVSGAPFAIAVCNGTVALHLALHCLDLGPGDEVIVPSFTYIASVNTIAQTGATPVFADVNASDWLINADDVAARITPRTRAILPVHLYGVPMQHARTMFPCTEPRTAYRRGLR